MSSPLMEEANNERSTRNNRGKRKFEMSEEEKMKDEEFWSNNPYFGNESSEDSDEDLDFISDSEEDDAEIDGKEIKQNEEENGKKPSFDKEIFMKNRMEFSFIRGIHYVMDIKSNCSRINNGSSYVKPPDSYFEKKFEKDKNEPILFENLNRNLVQIPFRCADVYPCEDKNEYLYAYYELEDSLYNQKYLIFNIKYINKILNELISMDINEKCYMRKLKSIFNNKIFKQYLQIDLEQLDHKKDGLHDILKKFEELLQTEELKLLKSSEIFKEESSKLLPVSINQLQFNQKSRELKTTANKNLTIYLTERFFFSKIYQDYPETLCQEDIQFISEGFKIYSSIKHMQWKKEKNDEKMKQFIRSKDIQKIPPIITIPFFTNEIMVFVYQLIYKAIMLINPFNKDKLIQTLERLTTSILKVDLEENKEFLDKIELFDENKLKNLLNKFKNSGDYMKKSLEIKEFENFEHDYSKNPSRSHQIHVDLTFLLFLIQIIHLAERFYIIHKLYKDSHVFYNEEGTDERKKFNLIDFTENLALSHLKGTISNSVYDQTVYEIFKENSKYFVTLKSILTMQVKNLQNIVADEISSKMLKMMIENINSEYYSICFDKISEELSKINDVEEVLCFSLDYNNDFDVIHVYPFVISKLLDSDVEIVTKEDFSKEELPLKKLKTE